MKKIFLNEIDYKKSSNIEQVSYDTQKKELTIKFKGGKEYIYPNIEEELVTEMVNAESVGKFFHENVRNLPFKQLLVDWLLWMKLVKKYLIRD